MSDNDMQSVLDMIRVRQEQIKALEIEVNDLRYVVSEHVKVHGSIVTDTARVVMSETTKTYSYDKDQIDTAIAMLSYAVSSIMHPLLSNILDILVKARKESVRPGSIRITFK